VKAFVLLAALAAVSACSREPAQPTVEAREPDQSALTVENAAGTYDYTLPDGSDGTTILASDGTFTDAMAGETVTGRWDVDGGKLCIDPAGNGAEQRRACYALGKPDANGVQVATSETGELIKVVKRPA
jgi:hypothetical protein